MLLKIYCENIVVEFLNFHFFFLYYFSILSFYHPNVSFFFFSLEFSPPHTYTHISLSYPFFFSTFHFPKPPSLFLSPALFLNFFFFHFLLDSNTLSNFLYNKKWRNRQRERIDWLDGSALLPPLVFHPTATAVILPITRLGQIGLFILFFLFSFFIFACSDSTLF